MMNIKSNVPNEISIILKIFYYLSFLGIIEFFLIPFIAIYLPRISTEIDVIKVLMNLQIFIIPCWIVYFYSIYFYFKYDRYSSSGIKLLILNIFYAQYYFYKVIWKRKRKLKNSYEPEPVLGNSIHLETDVEE